MQSRRAFLGHCGAGAAAWASLGSWGSYAVMPPGAVAELIDPDRLAKLSEVALERAKAAGATYADIRINRYRSQWVSLRAQADRKTGEELEVPAVRDSESFGFGLRVLARWRLGVLGQL